MPMSYFAADVGIILCCCVSLLFCQENHDKLFFTFCICRTSTTPRRAELALFREVLGAEATVTRTDHILADARRCVYRITRTASRTHAREGSKPAARGRVRRRPVPHR